MKKIIALSAAALLCGAALSAKTADELRIYINPGHGSWGPNDRPMSILRQVDTVLTVINPNTKSIVEANEGHTPDTTAFYESNTNLRKALALLDRLESYGLKFDRTKNQSGTDAAKIGAAKDLTNNIVMSHVKAGPYPYAVAQKASYNRDLTEIAVEAESNNFDMFISIHSNAATDGSTVNYLPFIYRGTDGEGGDRSPGSRNMAKACWPYAFGVKYQLWTARKTVDQAVIGDVTFYGSESASSAIPGCSGYLGVLKHNVPGFLVEGYFHTYQPSRQRAMNFDADRIEGYQYARGIADYFGLQKESTGEIYGLVRDLHEKFTHNLYTPQYGTNDCFKPLNGVTVTLKKDGAVVATKVTDNHYNGVFVFDNLQPGTYTLELSHPSYKPADKNQTTTVEVKAAETSYPEIFLENIDYVDLGEQYKNYPDELAEEPSVGPADEYVFNQEYVDEPIAELAGKNIRRTIVRGDKAIILAHDDANEPVIVLQDLTNKSVVRTLGTEGTVGSIAKIGDITMTAEGVLIGVNAGVQAFNGANNVKIYKWDNNKEDGLPEGNPSLLKEMNHAGNWNNAEFGKTITYSGTLQQGYLLISNNSQGKTTVRIELVAFENGEFGAYSHMNFNSNNIGDDKLGDFEFVMSPIHDDHFIITSELLPPMEVKVNKSSGGKPEITANFPENLIDGTGFRSSFFKYSGKTYMVAPDQVDGKNTGVTLLDVTNGLNKATIVTTTNTTLPSAADNTPAGMAKAWAQSGKGTTAANACVAVNRDSKGAYTSSAINLYVVRDDAKLSKITTANAEQPKQRGHFAYDLDMTKDADNYAITFKSTGEANKAKLILTNINDAEDVVTVDLGAVVPGENSATFDASTLPAGTQYNWAIEIDSKAIPAASRIFTAHTDGIKIGSRGGIVVMTDPEQQSYGKVVVAQGFAQGIEIYNPDLTCLGTYHANASTMNASNASSLFRGDQRDGKAYFADWSDAGAGYWIIDPQAPETLTNFLEGTKNTAGAYTVNGTVIGGGSSSIVFQGKGENCKMYSFVEDYPTGNAGSVNGGNTLQRYDIGTATTWGQAPNQTFSEISGNRYFANTNVELFATDNGLFVSQVRNADMNVAGAPAFVYIDNSGNILFNSGKDLEGVLNSGGSGIALTQDLKTLAIADPASGGITIMSVEWDNNTPSMTKLYTIPSTADNNNEHPQMRFDPAGNLHAFARGEGYRMFSLVNPEPKATTPARKALVINSSSTGVEDVVTGREVSLKVYPNPATDVVTVSAGEDITSLAIYSLTGAQMGVDTEVNGGEAVMNVSSLQNGAYIINVNGKSVKLIKR